MTWSFAKCRRASAVNSTQIRLQFVAEIASCGFGKRQLQVGTQDLQLLVVRTVWKLIMRMTVVGVISVLLAGCLAQATVRIEPNFDGSARVEIAIDLDREVVAGIGNPKTDLQFDDLRRGGWSVAIGDANSDGAVHISLARDCSSPDELADALGDTGIVNDVSISTSVERFKKSLNVEFVVDLTRGAQTFGDTQLAALVNSTAPLGVDTQTLTDRYGANLDSYFDVRVEVVQPEESIMTTSSNNDSTEANTLVWGAASGETTPVRVNIAKWRRTQVAIAGGAAACVLGLVLLAVGVTRRRYRSRHVENV